MKKIKTLSRLFTAVAKYLEDGKGHYICHACEILAGRGSPLAEAAMAIVMKRLGDNHSYYSWVYEHHRVAVKSVDALLHPHYARQGRVAWCRALAEEFKDDPRTF